MGIGPGKGQLQGLYVKKNIRKFVGKMLFQGLWQGLFQGLYVKGFSRVCMKRAIPGFVGKGSF